jgi:hypothetical protein
MWESRADVMGKLPRQKGGSATRAAKNKVNGPPREVQSGFATSEEKSLKRTEYLQQWEQTGF